MNVDIYVEGNDEWYVDGHTEQLLKDALGLENYADQRGEIWGVLDLYISDVDTNVRVKIRDDDDNLLWEGEER